MANEAFSCEAALDAAAAPPRRRIAVGPARARVDGLPDRLAAALPERTPASEQFVHLHTHSEYSLLDGLSRLRDLVDRAKAFDMPALALTDHGALYGAVDFYTTARLAGVKPIIGVETYVARGSRFDRDARIEGHGRPFHLVLLAKSFRGYQNLVSLITSAHLEGYYYRPRIDKELLREKGEGLIALSACLQGEVSRALQDQGLDAACAVASEHRELFGEDGYYLELMSHGVPEQEPVGDGIREVSRRTGIPLVVTNDIHYVNAEDAEAQDIMVCIQSGKTVDQSDRLKMIDHPELYLKSAAQMAALFPNDGAALENTLRIAELCNVELPMGNLILPHFEVPGGLTPDQQLRALAERGINAKYGAFTPQLRDRMEHELTVISKMGYAAYILIVQDFIRFAQERGILTAVRDVARVLGMSYGDDDRVAKVIPTGPTAPPLAESRTEVAELAQLAEEPEVSRLLDLAEKVEGLVRSTGTHAAGVVITRDPLTDLAPIERTKGKEGIQTQFEDKQLDKLGLLKFDFLGLTNLTILDHALRLITEQRGIQITRERIPLNDPKTFELLASGETTGLFQLESAGMRRYIRELKPDRVEDVMAMVALFRPGPMEYIPRYVA